MRAVKKSLEEGEPRLDGDKHMVPICAHQEDVKPVTKQVDDGNNVALLAEGVESDYAIHDGR